ncbi:DUF6161 domain-containing protein [Marinomonas aquimarina]|nr:DUF6161 domain-containing protein [Marinomonas aquimarina]
MDEASKTKRITIKTETGSKWFDAPQKLIQWIQDQRKSYSTLKQLAQQYNVNFGQLDSAWNTLHNTASRLQQLSNQPDQYDVHISQFQKQFSDFLNRKEIFTEDAPFFSFFSSQKEVSSIKGLAVLVDHFGWNFKPIDYQMLRALEETQDYFDGNQQAVNDQAQTMQTLRHSWDMELTEHRDIWTANYIDQLNNVEQLKEEANSLIKEWSLTQSEHKLALQEKLEKAETDLENLRRTYDEELSLRAPVKYWKMQHESHHQKAVGFGIVLLVVTLIVLCTIIGFSAYTLDMSLKDVTLSKIFAAAAITTIGLWLIKILANIFMSHLHLATDAQERRTMIHTYLALIRKVQGPAEDDRQLILQTLFRPSSTDMIKNDQGPSQLVDMINRLSTKQ